MFERIGKIEGKLMGRNNNKQKNKIILIVICFLFLSNTNFINDKHEIIKDEVIYDLDKMTYALYLGSLSNEEEYAQRIMNEERKFLNEKCEFINESDDFVTIYKLQDGDGNFIENESIFFNDKIKFYSYDNKIISENWGNNSYVYKGKESRYYIFTRWIGIIRLLKFEGDKLFVYIIKNNEWVLDPIHSDGKYCFIKQN